MSHAKVRPRKDKILKEGCRIISRIKDKVPMFHVRGFLVSSFCKPNFMIC